MAYPKKNNFIKLAKRPASPAYGEALAGGVLRAIASRLLLQHIYVARFARGFAYTWHDSHSALNDLGGCCSLGLRGQVSASEIIASEVTASEIMDSREVLTLKMPFFSKGYTYEVKKSGTT